MKFPKTLTAVLAGAVFGGVLMNEARLQNPIMYLQLAWPPVEFQSPIIRRDFNSENIDGWKVGYEDLGSKGLYGPNFYSGKCIYQAPKRMENGCIVPGSNFVEIYLENKNDLAQVKGR